MKLGFWNTILTPNDKVRSGTRATHRAQKLIKRFHRVRPEITDTWMLHHDNAPCHTAISVNGFLAKKYFSVPAATILA